MWVCEEEKYMLKPSTTDYDFQVHQARAGSTYLFMVLYDWSSTHGNIHLPLLPIDY